MEQDSIFEKFAQPEKVDFASVGKRGMTVMLAAGIVNPFGPTLGVVASDGSFNDGGCLPIVRMTVNPFSQECQVMGKVTVKDTWNPILDPQPFLSGLLQSAPTLLLPPVFLEHRDTVRMFGRFLYVFNGVSPLLAKVKRFPKDPWKRIDADMKSVSDNLPPIITGIREDMPPRESDLNPVYLAPALELAERLLDKDSMKAEFQAFLAAWDGAIEFQGNPKGVLSIRGLFEFLAKLGVTIKLPAMR
jgi:hypothetical protein